MALQLITSLVTQSNDATLLTISDNTKAYHAVDNTSGWGGPNTNLSDIDGSTTSLIIQITVTTNDGVETVYDSIDFFTLNTTVPTTTEDLVFILTPANLISDGVAMGAVGDKFIDGWYEIVYSIDHDLASGAGVINTYVIQKLIAGDVRLKIYDKYLLYPYHSILAIQSKPYMSNIQELLFPAYLATLYEGMYANANVSSKNEVLKQLALLNNLITTSNVSRTI